MKLEILKKTLRPLDREEAKHVQGGGPKGESKSVNCTGPTPCGKTGSGSCG